MKKHVKSCVEPRVEPRVGDSLAEEVRVTLIRSLSKMLGNTSYDKSGMYLDVTYEEKLREIDLKIAQAGQSRRALVRKRTRAERELEGIEVVLESVDGDVDVGEFLDERDKLQRGLDRIHLSIAQLDRDRRELKKERKRLESW